VATGEVDARALAAALSRLAVAGVQVTAAGVAGDAAVVVVPARERTAALRTLEATMDAVPTN
ncbi:MAG: hypothetical protein ABEJ61_06780, partial [Haloferacaceae archaeon]